MICVWCKDEITWQEWAHAFCPADRLPDGARHSVTRIDTEDELRACYHRYIEAAARTQP